jgi:hypothetical protein
MEKKPEKNKPQVQTLSISADMVESLALKQLLKIRSRISDTADDLGTVLALAEKYEIDPHLSATLINMLAHMADSLETLDEFVEMKCATEENGDLSLADIHSIN